jgi:hypothetical protein
LMGAREDVDYYMTSPEWLSQIRHSIEHPVVAYYSKCGPGQCKWADPPGAVGLDDIA